MKIPLPGTGGPPTNFASAPAQVYYKYADGLTVDPSGKAVMEGKRILFYDDNQQNRREAVRTLAASGCQVIIPVGAESLIQSIQSNPCHVLILDIEGHRLLHAQGLIPESVPTIILSRQPLTVIYPYLNQLDHFTNFIAKDRDDRLNHAEILGTTAKILSHDIFGIGKYLAWGASSFKHQITNSQSRPQVIRTLKSYCEDLHMRRSLIADAERVVEELLMNAIYDAPLNDQGERLFANLARTKTVELNAQQQACFEYGSDGRILAVSVSDPFGSISRNKIMEYLTKCFQGGNITNLDKPGGAGLGLFFCFRSVDSLIVNVTPGRCTEFVGLIDISATVKESKRKNTSLHYFNSAYLQGGKLEEPTVALPTKDIVA